jgi:hypothetical protein
VERVTPPSKEEWVAWKQSNTTQYLIQQLVKKRLGMLEEWADGRCSNEMDEQITKGRIQDLKDVIEYILMDFEYYQPEKEETSD